MSLGKTAQSTLQLAVEDWPMFAPRKTTAIELGRKILSGLTTLGALGATQLVGATLAVETSSLPAGEISSSGSPSNSLSSGSQTTPGLTELVHTVDSYSNFLQCMVCFIMLKRLKICYRA